MAKHLTSDEIMKYRLTPLPTPWKTYLVSAFLGAFGLGMGCSKGSDGIEDWHDTVWFMSLVASYFTFWMGRYSHESHRLFGLPPAREISPHDHVESTTPHPAPPA